MQYQSSFRFNPLRPLSTKIQKKIELKSNHHAKQSSVTILSEKKECNKILLKVQIKSVPIKIT